MCVPAPPADLRGEGQDTEGAGLCASAPWKVRLEKVGGAGAVSADQKGVTGSLKVEPVMHADGGRRGREKET